MGAITQKNSEGRPFGRPFFILLMTTLLKTPLWSCKLGSRLNR